MLVSLGGTPTWRLHTGLCKFAQNISTNIWRSRRRTDLKFGEVSWLFISYNRIISWAYSLNGFRVIFSNCVTVQPKNCSWARTHKGDDGGDGVAQHGGHSPKEVDGDIKSWFTVYFFDIGHQCYDQLTPVKTGYPLTSITWSYCGLKFTAQWGHMFFF